MKTNFIDGNESMAIEGTIVPAAFLNAVFNHRHDGIDEDGHCPLDYAVATGSANAYAISLAPALTAHIPGMPIHVKANHSNTGAATVAVNGLAAVAIKRRDGSDLVTGDIVNGAIVTLSYNGTAYQLLSQDLGIAATATSFAIENLSIAATVGSNAMTVAVKTKDGTDPSPTNPVRIAFRKTTLSDGSYDMVSLTSALSLVLSAGSTLGFAANESGRLYVWAINNSGAIKLGLSRTADIFREGNLHTSVAEGGSGGADSASAMYADAAYAAKAVRCIGYIEITTGATAGNWTTAPSKIQLMGPGVPRTGDVIQRVRTEVTTYTSTATTIPLDDTIPQNTEGGEMMTQAITPTSAVNILRVKGVANCYFSGAQGTVALFRDSAAGAVSAVVCYMATAEMDAFPVVYEVVAGSTVATTFKVRIGQETGSAYFNGTTSGRKYGGVLKSYMEIEEVFA